MTKTLIAHREKERQAIIDRGGPDLGTKSLLVWTSTRRRTIETSQFFLEEGYQVRQRSQMGQLNPGVCEKMSERSIREQMPEEVAKHEGDPYHHRYPRAEVSFISYHITLFPYTLQLSFLLKNTLLSYKVIPRSRGPPRTHHPRARTRTKRPAHHCPRIRPARPLRLSHGLQRLRDPHAEVPSQRNPRNYPREL